MKKENAYFVNDNKTYTSEEIVKNIEQITNVNSIKIKCDFQVSDKCKKEYFCTGKSIKKTLINNNEKLICIFCHHAVNYLGRNNPNTKYRNLDDNFFSAIDSSYKAYLLGWVASDGSVNQGGFTIKIHEKDLFTLIKIRDIICADLPIKIKDDMCEFTVCSQKIRDDISRLLSINWGKKCFDVQMPVLENDEYTWSFIRGYFDGNGSINTPGVYKNYPQCSISSNSILVLQQIKDFIKIKSAIYGSKLEITGNNALDFLSKLYDNTDVYLNRKYDLYLDWSIWTPSLSGFNNYGKGFGFRWAKTRKDAFPPHKTLASNTGYDLTILEKIKTVGEVELYDTGIKVQPDYGIYFDLVPRSSVVKTGYILANSVGVIDRNYTGNILIPLIKYDKNAPDLTLPFRIAQIIPRIIVHLQPLEVTLEEFEETNRGEGGFGSTGNVNI